MFRTDGDRPARRSRHAASMCATCLAADRALFSLKKTPQFVNICSGLNLSMADMVCFECRAILRNFVKFRNRALRAEKLLECVPPSCNLKNSQSFPGFQCLSTLTETVIPAHKTIYIGHNSDGVKEEVFHSQVKQERSESIITSVEPYVPMDCLKTEGYSSTEEEAMNVKTEAKERIGVKSNDEETETWVEVDEVKPQKLEDVLVTAGRPNRPFSEVPYFDVKQIDHEEAVGFLARERETDAYKRAPFKCDKCALAFRSEKNLKNHNALHSEQRGTLVCDICDQRFRKSPDLIAHTAKHYTRYDCKHCARVDNIRARMDEHYKRKHDRSPRPCPKCSETFTSYADMLQHKRTAHATEYTCEHCCRVFSANYKLQYHLQRKHTKTSLVECDVCHKQCKGQYNLQKHIRKAHNKEPSSPNENAYCAECNIQFKEISLYKAHINNTSRHVAASAFRYECDYCGKKFVHKQYVSHHIELMHLKLAKYKCDVCDQSFPTSVYRNRHKRLKHADKPRKKFVCHTCGKGFTVRKSLDQHTNSHLGLRPFVCKQCGATFTYSAALYTHNQLVHLKRKRGNPIAEEQ